MHDLVHIDMNISMEMKSKYSYFHERITTIMAIQLLPMFNRRGGGGGCCIYNYFNNSK